MIAEEKPQKSLDRWRHELKLYGKKHWLRFYEEFLGTGVSNISRFYRALNLYDEWPVFEAILDSSMRKLEGDPLNYVIKVAHEKWKTSQQQEDADADYTDAIKKSQEASRKANENLAKKLRRKSGK